MKTEYFDLKNKRALVSGGASGIGSSIVEHLCDQGVEVYYFDINKNEAKKTIKKIKKKKFKIPSFVECNIKNIKKYKYSILKIPLRHFLYLFQFQFFYLNKIQPQFH